MTTTPPTPKSVSALLAEAKVTDTIGEPPLCYEEGSGVAITWGSGVNLKMVTRAEKALKGAGHVTQRRWHGQKFQLFVTAQEG